MFVARCLPRRPYRRRLTTSASSGGFSVEAAVLAWTQTGARPPWLSDELLGVLEQRTGRLVGVIYQTHFDQPVGDVSNPRGFASHYTGWTLNLPVRLGEHAAGRGARLMQVVAEQGIAWQVTRLWAGTRARERSLKRQGGAARRCPVCRLAAGGAAVPASDQAVLDALELGDRPACSPPRPPLSCPCPPDRPACPHRPPPDHPTDKEADRWPKT
jgi:hypothetical protein